MPLSDCDSPPRSRLCLYARFLQLPSSFSFLTILFLCECRGRPSEHARVSAQPKEQHRQVHCASFSTPLTSLCRPKRRCSISAQIPERFQYHKPQGKLVISGRGFRPAEGIKRDDYDDDDDRIALYFSHFPRAVGLECGESASDYSASSATVKFHFILFSSLAVTVWAG